MSKVSVVIPSRNEPFLGKTVDDVLKNASGEVEVIVMLDGYWPPPDHAPKPNKSLAVVHTGDVKGMRANINAAARIATGKYLMKLDAHCMVAPGFDEALKADCEPDWLAVPSRYALDAEKWERGRGPTDYLMLTFPYTHDAKYGTGFHGKKWQGEFGEGPSREFYRREKERADILIDDILTFQGSCWFMHREQFFKLGGLDEDRFYNIHQEAQELGFKVWLSGGRCVRNKKTWYAHLHKGQKYGRGFRLSKQRMVQSEQESIDYWMNNRWPGAKRPLKWLIEKFLPMDGWPEDWDDPKYAEQHVHPRADLLN